MIDPGKEPEIRQLENGLMKVAKRLPWLLSGVFKIFGRVGKGIYNGLLGRTAVKPESKEAANQKNKKEHPLVKAVVGITKGIGALVKGLSYVARGSYNTVQKLRGKELEKIKNEPSLSRENSLRRENPVKRENPVGAKDKNQVKNSKLTNQKKRVISSKLTKQKNPPVRHNNQTKQKNLAKDALKKSVSFTEKQRRVSAIKTHGIRKAARINAMKRKQAAHTPQRTQPAPSLGT